jgi:hypothetical protein
MIGDTGFRECVESDCEDSMAYVKRFLCFSFLPPDGIKNRKPLMTRQPEHTAINKLIQVNINRVLFAFLRQVNKGLFYSS